MSTKNHFKKTRGKMWST